MKRVLFALLAGTLFVCLAVGGAASQERPQGGATAISGGNSPQTTQGVRVVGVLKKQGITSHMYGSHTIRDAGTGRLCALRSSYPKLLDRYVGRRVVVYGTRVPNFPIDFGPPLLDVYAVSPALRSS